MRDVVVVGGGCYGTFYAGQLAKAKQRGKAHFRRVVVVDRDPACRARGELGQAQDRTFVVRGLAERVRAAGDPVQGRALFVCGHHVFGVGTFAVDAVIEGGAMVRAAGESGSAAAVLVGTISSCHGAVNLLRIGAAKAATGG